MKLNVIYLYRTGGSKYTREDVLMLHNEVAPALANIPCRNLCLTDDDSWSYQPFTTRLQPQLPLGWWGKPFVFEISGPALYLDLDTWIVKGDRLERFAEMLIEKHNEGISEIWMLESFRWRRGATTVPIERWASGIMAWTGDKRWIAESFDFAQHAEKYKWDQRFISDTLAIEGVPVSRIQDYMNVYSYHRHCAGGVPPDDADIVCFHGSQTPRRLKV